MGKFLSNKLNVLMISSLFLVSSIYVLFEGYGRDSNSSVTKPVASQNVYQAGEALKNVVLNKSDVASYSNTVINNAPDYISPNKGDINSSVDANDNFELKKVLNTHKAQFQFIVNKLAEMHLPKSLALIPVIESSYNPNDVSNKGAAGIWQLMPQTAVELGIASSQRGQLAPSTVAALTYFKQLHQKFGNWEFAIAAYNAGDGRVQKAIHQNPNATSVQQLNLPRETKNYVQSFFQLQNELKSYQA